MTFQESNSVTKHGSINTNKYNRSDILTQEVFLSRSVQHNVNGICFDKMAKYMNPS